MRGSNLEPGVIPLALHDLFDTIKKDASREFTLRMSYLEIYNEDINDLLAPENRKLQIHANVEKGISIAGLREVIVASSQQALKMMKLGDSQRHIGETSMNFYSSRSHTIFRMIIESRRKTKDEEGVGNACDAVRFSVLNLVDLAGSERAAKTGAEGARLKEGSHINKSLMTLGTVITKLSEGIGTQGGHVPYRESKLTRILQPALAGNANIAVICNITLAQIHADETKSSLEFAKRAMGVTNCAHVNEILTDADLLKRQKTEIKELRFKLKTARSVHSEEEIISLRNTLLKCESERQRLALELEEEKKAKAQSEIVLQEQAKKINKLSSLVLFSNSDVKCEKDLVDALLSEFQKTKGSVETISSVMDKCLQDFAFFSPLIQDFRLFVRQSFEQYASLIISYQNVQSCLKQKVLDIENEKLLLQEKCVGLQNLIEELNYKAQKHETSIMMVSEHHEGDIIKHEPFTGKRHESFIVERSASQPFKKIEVLAFELEATTTSLEEALYRNEGLDSEVTALTEKLEHSNIQIEHLLKAGMDLKMKIEDSSSVRKLLETNVKQLLEEKEELAMVLMEKEELAMHLASSLSKMMEEKAIWSSKEKNLTEAMEENIRMYNMQLESLSKEKAEAKEKLESCRLECVTCADRLSCSEENANQGNECSMEKSLEIDSLGDELKKSDGARTVKLRVDADDEVGGMKCKSSMLFLTGEDSANSLAKRNSNDGQAKEQRNAAQIKIRIDAGGPATPEQTTKRASESETTLDYISVVDTDNNVAGRQGARNNAPASKEADEEQLLAPDIIYVDDDEVVEVVDVEQLPAPDIIYVDDDVDEDEVVEVVVVSSSSEKSGEVAARRRPRRRNRKPVKYVLVETEEEDE